MIHYGKLLSTRTGEVEHYVVYNTVDSSYYTVNIRDYTLEDLKRFGCRAAPFPRWVEALDMSRRGNHELLRREWGFVFIPLEPEKKGLTKFLEKYA